MKNVGNPLIFIVEENQIYMDLIVNYLNEKKLKNIRSFHNGDECFKSVHLNPDIVVLDYSMSGMNSLEFMQKIKILKPKTDFIFLSALNDVDVAVHCMKHGAFDYIVKSKQAPEKLARAIINDIGQTKKSSLKNSLRKGVVGLIIILIVFILMVVGLRYLFNW